MALLPLCEHIYGSHPAVNIPFSASGHYKKIKLGLIANHAKIDYPTMNAFYILLRIQF